MSVETQANSVNTKQVQGRRKVRYGSSDELLADAERRAQPDVRRVGNWSPGQIYEHLAIAMNNSIDGMDFMLPAPVRLVMNLFMKRKFIKQEIPPGFKAPSSARPDEIAAEAGLESLRQAVERVKTESGRALHPAFGKITREEWDEFHLRHAEMHMSFLVADGDELR